MLTNEADQVGSPYVPVPFAAITSIPHVPAQHVGAVFFGELSAGFGVRGVQVVWTVCFQNLLLLRIGLAVWSGRLSTIVTKQLWILHSQINRAHITKAKEQSVKQRQRCVLTAAKLSQGSLKRKVRRPTGLDLRWRTVVIEVCLENANAEAIALVVGNGFGVGKTARFRPCI